MPGMDIPSAIERVEDAYNAWVRAHPAMDDKEADDLIAAVQDYKATTAAVIAAIPRS